MDQGMIYWIQLYVNFNSKFESFNNEIIDALSSNLDILKAKIIDPFFSDTQEKKEKYSEILSPLKEQVIKPFNEYFKNFNEQLEKKSILFSTDFSEKMNSCSNEFKELFSRYEYFSKIDINSITEENMSNLIEELDKFVNDLKTLVSNFYSIINDSYQDFSNYIFKCLKYNYISEDDLNTIINISNLSEEQKNVIKEAINKFKTEQQSIKDNEGENVNENQPPSDNLRNQEIEYVAGTNYFDSIKDSRLQQRISRLQEMIDTLNARKSGNGDKLSIAENLKLYDLVAEKENLEEMLRNQKKSDKRGKLADLREKKLDNLNNDINELNQKITDERRKLEQRRSKILKFISARKLKMLENKVSTLQKKFGKVKSTQAAAAIHAYDSQQRMASFKAKLKLTGKGFKKVGTGFVTGAGHVASFARATKRELNTLIDELSNKTGSMTGEPSIVDSLARDIEANMGMTFGGI